jgi:hypothetical protein
MPSPQQNDIVVIKNTTRLRFIWLIFSCLAIGAGTGIGLVSSRYGDEETKKHSGLIGFLGFYLVTMIGIFVYSVKKTSRNGKIHQQPSNQETPRMKEPPEFTDMNHERLWDQENVKLQKLVELVKSHSGSSDTSASDSESLNTC